MLADGGPWLRGSGVPGRHKEKRRVTSGLVLRNHGELFLDVMLEAQRRDETLNYTMTVIKLTEEEDSRGQR